MIALYVSKGEVIIMTKRIAKKDKDRVVVVLIWAIGILVSVFGIIQGYSVSRVSSLEVKLDQTIESHTEDYKKLAKEIADLRVFFVDRMSQFEYDYNTTIEGLFHK